MRRLIVLIAIVLFIWLPSMAATKTTVKQLDELLADQHKLARTDEATAVSLKDLHLTEQLTTAAINGLTRYDPGPLTITQIRILAADSSLLPSPPSDLPAVPVPDKAAQSAIIARAVDYATHQFATLPKLSAEKVTTRYQNGIEYIQTNSGTSSNFANGSPELNPINQYLRILGEHTSPVQSEGGVELPPAKVKGLDPASQNGQISQGGSGPVLGMILMDAGKGQISWLRWESIDDKQIAVFAFAVDKKQSQYRVDYCCFPVKENVGSAIPVGNMGGMSAAHGTVTTFKPFLAKPGYHGQLFIDPETGTIVRLITQADLKPTDFVHQEDIRVDYSRVNIGGKQYVVPVKSVILTEVVPNGDSYVKYSTRRTLFDMEYRNYQLR